MIYGLDADGEAVLGDVFAKKVATLVQALKVADRSVNGSKRHTVLVEGLSKGSARVEFRERRSSRKPVSGTGSSELGRAFTYAYQGAIVQSSSVSPKLLSYVRKLADGAETTFSHAEAIFDDNKVIRIDKFFASQLAYLTPDVLSNVAEGQAYFVGRSNISFDGYLRVLDSRGHLLRATLILSAGSRSIDCMLPQRLLEEAKLLFESRVLVSGVAIYAGRQLLPQRFEVEGFRRIRSEVSLLAWKGKFRFPPDFLVDSWTESSE